MDKSIKVVKRRSTKVPMAKTQSARSSPGAQTKSRSNEDTNANGNGLSKRKKTASSSPRPRNSAVALAETVDEKQHLKNDIQNASVYNDDMLRELEERGDADSICEDIIGSSIEDQVFPDIEGACTLSESMQLRRLLRQVGPLEFLRRTLDSGVFTAEKLLTAFSVRPPDFLQGRPDEDYLPFLSLAMTRELQKRAKLEQYNSFDDAVNLIKRSKNIIVLTGAGISTSLGIPDFRSKNIGLYSMLGDLGLDDPQQVFDLGLFHEDPSIFYSIARKVLPNHERCSPTHAFIAMLQEKGKLLTNYTQNIDNIEETAGIDPERLVQCHGSWSSATCIRCGHKVPGKTIFPVVEAGGIPRCEKCGVASAKASSAQARNSSSRSRQASKSRKRKTSHDDDDSDGTYSGGPVSSAKTPGRALRTSARHSNGAAGPEIDASRRPVAKGEGIMKPDITFFGEALPRRFGERLLGHDRDLVDLVIVIGTSLKVKPVSELVPVLPANVPQIYISRDPVSHVHFDIDLLGDCDVVVAELCRRAGWDLDHEMIPENQEVETELAEGYWSRHYVRAVKK
ncbi:hypothetical protein MCOR27_004416 [Pyricularia oryzae]|uniref:Deacetylase sirtuin-type domain-containing protein n=5 Tax=Pyricularia TaxID=48558 RepID=A0ABQ8NV53_PYRGI|nr:NAD-dependent histone deacetylase SIR2 [Pyricularia oryzae 70-15]ELQ35359.1 NAD-dependent histone deacetylase SIR2 [Pyricularia oryzae Y34]KAH8842554.1 hypothetical protein MCOR01_006460 [Pyricularia oryzae]KAI6302550.1 hypothetical protein MCOR33_002139 [Pyricularia grisea]EHA56672.1 NAD-dependent histone deacetylase SIR2 [Pyricularia oryzae 70-15]KAH9435804.1 hypothetical protein MCOR02_004723 [Pyricularia oryzae]